ASRQDHAESNPSPHAWERLVGVVQELSMARSLPAIMNIVRTAARQLTGADGASFVLRDGDKCFYAEEDAIAPLWKGKRFPISTCVSGWVMLNRRPAVIPDIYSDARVPADAYRPTFVKSLAMVPIRTADPLGAIGNYWATMRQPTAQEVALLAALADTTSVAIENVQLYESLEQRVRERTAELQVANRELEAFSYSVSHDLRAPLRAIMGFSQLLSEDCGKLLDENGKQLLGWIDAATTRMDELIDSLLALSRVTRMALKRQSVDLRPMVEQIIAPLRRDNPQRQVEFIIGDDLMAEGDAALLRIVMENLLSNAWKYTSKRQAARIEIGKTPGSPDRFFVRDNGAGFEMAYAQRLFSPFQRMHTAEEFSGTGVGLATVQRAIHRHGGRIWAEAAPEAGATFYFTLSGGEGGVERAPEQAGRP
ncbi:MAG TPA: ATP-binding protein, partial [Tepidisphaeraceae bacterium]|nr:ATP-binding protein [Tepidisphaeraceae bacterium]